MSGTDLDTDIGASNTATVNTTNIATHADATQKNPFRLGVKPQWLSASIEKALCLHDLAEHYDNRPQEPGLSPSDQVDAFLDYAIDSTGVEVLIKNEAALEAIPREGATIFVSNHPLGGLEGVVMSRMLKQIRPDLKVLTNELLTLIPEFSELFIGVDVLSKNAASKNVKGMREVVKHLRGGGALLIYPAGRVSAIDTSDFAIRDREWTTMIGRLVKQFEATCVPFFVHGKNSRLFYWAGLVHARLRTALLPREMARNSQRKLPITVGDAILWRDIRSLETEQEITQYLRAASDLLEKRNDSNTASGTRFPELKCSPREETTLKNIQQNLRSISEYKLLELREFDVYCAPFDALPNLMTEIAIARERTFRLAGEGTGSVSDSDRYDPHYLHLFVWDRENMQVVGGYRLGQVDKIVAKFGVDGLYSRSLYKFKESFIEKVDGALEMGRSFVTPEYQRNPKALDLLWRGIGAWVVKNPGYATLFGCVSISQEHSVYARAFLKESLMHSFRAEQEHLNQVRPLAPLKVKDKIWASDVLSSLKNVVLINKLLGQCDPGKSIPVLLRQYIALNGRFAGFSVNRDFNDSLDGLIFVDLRKTPQKYLQRYLGKQGSQKFLSLWGVNGAAA